MASKNFRIDIPTNADDLIGLAKSIKTKHDALADDSPIKGVKDIASFGAKLSTADTKNALSKQLYKDAEKATQDRDLALQGAADSMAIDRAYRSALATAMARIEESAAA